MKSSSGLNRSQVTYVVWLLLLLVTLLFTEQYASAQVYKWVDESGQVHYGDKKPDEILDNTSSQIKVEALELKIYQPKPDPEVRLKDVEANAGENTTVIKWTPTSNNTNKENHLKKKRRGNLVMYATKVCGYCKKARAYFKTNKIRYHEIDINASSENHQRFKNQGGHGVPYFVMNNHKKAGWSEKGFEQFYYED